MFSPSDLKKGLKIQIDGAPWIITEFDFCKPGKGTALYRCRLKNRAGKSRSDRDKNTLKSENVVNSVV